MIERREAKAEAERTLTWRVCPFLENRYRSAAAVAVVIGLTALVYFIAPADPFFIAAPPFMFLALHEFFLPTRYVLSKDAIEIKRFMRPKKFDWGRFRAFNYDDTCAVLSPNEGPARRVPLRNVLLRFDKSRRDEIIEYLRQRLTDVKARTTASQ